MILLVTTCDRGEECATALQKATSEQVHVIKSTRQPFPKPRRQKSRTFTSWPWHSGSGSILMREDCAKGKKRASQPRYRSSLGSAFSRTLQPGPNFPVNLKTTLNSHPASYSYNAIL